MLAWIAGGNEFAGTIVPMSKRYKPTFRLNLAVDKECPYVIEVNFEAIHDLERRKYFLSLPTSFSLDKDQVQALIDVGPRLLDESPDFLAFIQSLLEKGSRESIFGGIGPR